MIVLPITPQGVFIDCTVDMCQAQKLAYSSKGLTIPPSIKIRALIDTGATRTTIDRGILVSLGLSPIGSLPAGVADGSCSEHPIYAVDLTVHSQPLRYSHKTIPVFGPDLSKVGVQALLGRDLLMNFVFTYIGGENQTILTL